MMEKKNIKFLFEIKKLEEVCSNYLVEGLIMHKLYQELGLESLKQVASIESFACFAKY